MGYLSDSLKQAGYLQPLAQGFGEFADALQSRKEQNTFNQLMSSAVSGIQNNLQQDSAVHNTFTPGNQSALSQLMPKNFVQAPQNTQSQPEQNIMKSLQPSVSTPPNDIAPAQYSQMTPLQQKQKNMRIIANTLMQSTQFKNLPQEMKDKAIQSLQLMAQGSEAPIPTTELKEIAPGGTLAAVTQTEGQPPQVQTIGKGAPKNPVDEVSTVLDPKGQPKIKSIGDRKFITEKHVYENGDITYTDKELPKSAVVNIQQGDVGAYKGYVKDYAKVQTGINEVKTLKNQIYNDKNYYDRPIGNSLNTERVVDVATPQEVKPMTKEAAESYKEQLKNKNKLDAIIPLKNLKVDKYTSLVSQYAAKKRISSRDALTAFEEKNPQLTDTQKEALEAYFELDSQ